MEGLPQGPISPIFTSHSQFPTNLTNHYLPVIKIQQKILGFDFQTISFDLQCRVSVIKPKSLLPELLLAVLLLLALLSLCSGAEFLLQMVREAVPKFWLDSQHSAPAAEVAVHILDQLYKKLNETCLVQGGEEAYRMLLYLFLGSLLPYIEVLDSWIFEGILLQPD